MTKTDKKVTKYLKRTKKIIDWWIKNNKNLLLPTKDGEIFVHLSEHIKIAKMIQMEEIAELLESYIAISPTDIN